MSSNIVAGANDTLAESGIIGDPSTYFDALKEPLQFVTGNAMMFFIVAVVLSIVVGGGYSVMGGSFKLTAVRNHGIVTILMTPAVVIAVIIALIVVWSLVKGMW